MAARAGGETKARVDVVSEGQALARSDRLATEEPLELRIVAGGERKTLAVTMRTPGSDFELAAGFFFSEGVVSARRDIARISYCVDRDIDPEQLFNIVNVQLAAERLPNLRSLERYFFTSSACGVCGKATLDDLELRGCQVIPSRATVTAAVLYELPSRLRAAQGIFEHTGGLHAAGLFDPDGELIALREDVGRHNALDKLVGWALLQDRLPLDRCVLMVSGRASYEIMQKALMARVGIVCAVSAPSSLAVDVARRFGITLVGFLRGDRFNIYNGAERIEL